MPIVVIVYVEWSDAFTRVGTDRQTDTKRQTKTHDEYSNPHCARGTTNQIAWFVISITSVRYVQEFSHFSRDYETLMMLYVVMLAIIKFRWNSSMYVMVECCTSCNMLVHHTVITCKQKSYNICPLFSRVQKTTKISL